MFSQRNLPAGWLAASTASERRKLPERELQLRDFEVVP